MTLTYSEIYSRAWNNMKNNLAFIAVLSFVFCLGMAAFSKIPFLGYVLSTILTASYYNALLQIKKGKTIDYKDFFWGFLDLNRAIKLLILGAATTIGLALGIIFLVIPGIWFLVAACFSNYIFVSRNQDPFEAIKESLRMVKGHWWYYLGLMLTACLVMIAGLCCFVIGIFVSLPLVTFAYIEAVEHFYHSNNPATANEQSSDIATTIAPEPPPLA